MEGMFTGVEESEEFRGGVYMRPGVYEELEVLACKVGKNRKGRAFFVAELKVHKSSGENANEEGTTVAWMVMKDNDGFLSTTRGFAAHLFGVEFDDVTEKSLDLLVSEKQPGAGKRIAAQADNVKTKKGGDFTKVQWRHVPPKPKAEVAA